MSTNKIFQRHNLNIGLRLINDNKPFEDAYFTDCNSEDFNKPLKNQRNMKFQNEKIEGLAELMKKFLIVILCVVLVFMAIIAIKITFNL